MEQPACNGRCLGWLSVSLIDHYVGDKPSMALAVENKVANFFIKTINSATQKVDKVKTCSKVAKHKQFLESFIFRISVGFSSFLFFCSSATLETINIWNASIYNLHLPFFVDFSVDGWLRWKMMLQPFLTWIGSSYLIFPPLCWLEDWILWSCFSFDFSRLSLLFPINFFGLELLRQFFSLLWLTHEIYNEITRKERRSRKASSSFFPMEGRGINGINSPSFLPENSQ